MNSTPSPSTLQPAQQDRSSHSRVVDGRVRSTRPGRLRPDAGLPNRRQHPAVISEVPGPGSTAHPDRARRGTHRNPDRHDGTGSADAQAHRPLRRLIYDSAGNTWVYTNPEPQVYVRQSITVERSTARCPPDGRAAGRHRRRHDRSRGTPGHRIRYGVNDMRWLIGISLRFRTVVVAIACAVMLLVRCSLARLPWMSSRNSRRRGWKSRPRAWA